MPEHACDPADPAALAIIGGGAAGVIAALHALALAPAGARIVLVEAAGELGAGVAYAGDRPEHLLNVVAGRMSAFPERPNDFVAYLLEQDPVGTATAADLANRFVPRPSYRRYLQARLTAARAASPARLEVHRGRAIALRHGGATLSIELESGARLRATGAILAPGNRPRPLPGTRDPDVPPARLVEAWDEAALAGIPEEAAVLVVGAGLSMVDVALGLDARGHRGPLHVLARHALLPLPHTDRGHQGDGIDASALVGRPLRAVVRGLRGLAGEAVRQGRPWQDVLDAVRPHVQSIWRGFEDADRRRFLRHARRHWDIHRHRIAAPAQALIARDLAGGRLRLHRGRLRHLTRIDGGVRAEAEGCGGPFALDVTHVVNATGIAADLRDTADPLLAQLLADGMVQPDPLGLGLATDLDGRPLDARGRAAPNLRLLGSLRIGTLWESTAVPDLRMQAADAARALLVPR
ncbi:FAD/NAD(P)-binding protein [Coralloluteibacterium stylophorae]|uniref:FAD/NAD(P)-binding protein n=1 Tax=Coralloluteibacterium stylophorae TaxID=1776034 RepID=A0A8J8AZ21_9GAMM|nr:FAD/NAD(P)-binding protein [Coralloluteibacterium stylophorae]MBS7457084.1 FAD/NAD(P)-binding protein [Coralloluteibacterium stylophorae]